MASKLLVPVLITLMLVTGVCNTLLTKYQDIQCVRNCDDPDPARHEAFEQPVIQTAQMFIGETGCWLVVYGLWLYRRCFGSGDLPTSYQAIRDSEEEEVNAIEDSPLQVDAVHPPIPKASNVAEETRLPLAGLKIALLAIPAMCDILGTTLMNVGLLFVVASVYQMTRGALVLFVGLFSVLFLKRHLYAVHWLALVTVVAGVGVVGFAGVLTRGEKLGSAEMLTGIEMTALSTTAGKETSDPLRTAVGILLIAGAQIFTAAQFVLEEFILHKYALEPLKVVGWEGLFGFLMTGVGMLILHLAVGRTVSGQYGYFDLVNGFHQLFSNPSIWISSLLIMCSIGGFNFFGLSVTRTVSATSRSTIDTCRTLFIWIISLGLQWETFKWLQVVGFAMLVYGTFLFNGLVRPPLNACIISDNDPGDVRSSDEHIEDAR